MIWKDLHSSFLVKVLVDLFPYSQKKNQIKPWISLCMYDRHLEAVPGSKDDEPHSMDIVWLLTQGL